MPSVISTAWSAPPRPSCCRRSSIAEGVQSPRSGARRLRLAAAESFPIVAWTHVEVALERVAHPVFVAKAGAARDGFDTLVGVFEQAARRLQSEQLDGFGGRAARLGLVDARKITRT